MRERERMWWKKRAWNKNGGDNEIKWERERERDRKSWSWKKTELEWEKKEREE